MNESCDQRIILKEAEERALVTAILRQFVVVVRHSKRVEERLKPIIQVTARCQNLSRRVKSVPTNREVALHVP